MSIPLSALSGSPASAMFETNRRSANYIPSIWGDHFLAYDSNSAQVDEHVEQQARRLKEDVRRLLMSPHDKTSQKLHLIDDIQRLGVAYHFESEIEKELRYIYETNNHYDGDLNTVALRFRLLRQEGYDVSCDVFNKFKDEKGNFKESLVNDIQGMLSLYEAAHLMVHGEAILDEAVNFTTSQLKASASTLSTHLVAQVTHAINQPIRKGLTRLEARYYISTYEHEDSHNKALLKFAKLDFNILQIMHQRELCSITKWYKELDVPRNFPFARDRAVECYFWILGVFFEPQYSFARMLQTKVIFMTSILDDIYDAYGTFEELQLYTEAISRWNVDAVGQLPEYMKVHYLYLLALYDEIEEELAKQGKANHVYYGKEAMKNLAKSYFLEAKWLHEDYVPPFEEYMDVASITAAYPMLVTSTFVVMGDIVTTEMLDWVFTLPKIVKASTIISRLMDDIVGHKDEQERGHVASSIECYMKQYGASEEEAIEELKKQLTDAWKDINEECLNPTPVPKPLVARILNYARVIAVLYKDVDGYTNAPIALKDSVASVLVDPVPI